MSHDIKTPDGVEWLNNTAEGEYNEHIGIVDGKRLTVYSDRDETEWSYTVDNDEPIRLNATTLIGALREAVRDYRSA